jgi:hypothetical protein
MAGRVDPALDERLPRLERLALLGFVERHGLRLGAGVDAQPLREQAVRDAAAIAREQREPQLETRSAAWRRPIR